MSPYRPPNFGRVLFGLGGVSWPGPSKHQILAKQCQKPHKYQNNCPNYPKWVQIRPKRVKNCVI